MRLKSLEMQQQKTKRTTTTIRVKNQRIKTCVSNMFLLLYLLSSQVWSYANINFKESRFVRQVKSARIVNYEDARNTYQQPHFTGNRSVIVQLFEWKFVDIAAECRDFLGPQGYAGVQISPILEHTVVKTSDIKHPWWERYEVVSYRLASRSGDETEFWSMSRICNDHGVRIYADVVLNHMAAPLQHLIPNLKNNKEETFIVNTLLKTNVNISQLNYSNVTYTQQDFHRPHCLVLENTQDAHEIRNCQLNGHPDLDHSRTAVQKHIVQMLNKFIDMGVAGFRIDTAKYIWPIDLKNIFQQVKNLNTEFNFEKNSRPFLYYDVFDLGLDTISKTEYITYGVVSEYLYPAELATIINGKVPLSSLINWGPALGFVPHDDSVVFVDSHDTQRDLPKQLGMNKMLTYKQRLKYIMANVFMLVHPYGHVKRIMSSYYFTDKNQGPPTDDEEGEEIRSPKFNEQQKCTKESGWVCEHRWPELLSVLKVANYFKVPGQEDFSVIYFQTNGPNQVAFCRGHKAFVAINNDWDRDFEMEVFACLEPGTYCDMVTGGKKEGKEECHGQKVVINEQGYTKLQLKVADGNNEQGNGEELEEEELGRLENYGILVIYVESKIKPNQKADATGDTKVVEMGEANSQEKINTEEAEGGNSKADDNEAAQEEVVPQVPNEGADMEEPPQDTSNDKDEEEKKPEEETEAEQIEQDDEDKEEPVPEEEPAEANEEPQDEKTDNQEDTEKTEDTEGEVEANEEENSDNQEAAEDGEANEEPEVEEPKEDEPEEEKPKEEEPKEEEEPEVEEPKEEEPKEEEPKEEEPEEEEEPEVEEPKEEEPKEDEPEEDLVEAELKEEEPKEEEPKEEEPEEPKDKEPNEEELNEGDAEETNDAEELAEETAADETEAKEGEAEDLVKETSAETIAPAENLVKEPNEEAEDAIEDIAHNQSRALEDKAAAADEQIEEPLVVEEEGNNEDTDKPRDVVAAGVLVKLKGNG